MLDLHQNWDCDKGGSIESGILCSQRHAGIVKQTRFYSNAEIKRLNINFLCHIEHHNLVLCEKVCEPLHQVYLSVDFYQQLSQSRIMCKISLTRVNTNNYYLDVNRDTRFLMLKKFTNSSLPNSLEFA